MKEKKNKFVDTTVLLTRRYNTPSRGNIEEKNTETLPLFNFSKYHHHHLVFPRLSFPHISATIKTYATT